MEVGVSVWVTPPPTDPWYPHAPLSVPAYGSLGTIISTSLQPPGTLNYPSYGSLVPPYILLSVLAYGSLDTIISTGLRIRGTILRAHQY